MSLTEPTLDDCNPDVLATLEELGWPVRNMTEARAAVRGAYGLEDEQADSLLTGKPDEGAR